MMRQFSAATCNTLFVAGEVKLGEIIFINIKYSTPSALMNALWCRFIIYGEGGGGIGCFGAKAS